MRDGDRHRTDPSENASVRLIESVPFIRFDLYKSAWSFPEGSPVAVRLDFDDRKPLDLMACGDGQIVSIAIPAGLTLVFLSLLNDRQHVRVFSGTEMKRDDLSGWMALVKRW